MKTLPIPASAPAKRLGLRNHDLSLTWARQGLSLQENRGGTLIFRNAGFRVSAFDGQLLTTEHSARVVAGVRKLMITAAGASIEAVLRCSLNRTRLCCAMELTNRGDRPIRLGYVDILYFQRARGSATHLLQSPVQVFSLGALTGESEQMWSKEKRNKKVFALTLDAGQPEYAADNIFCARPVEISGLTREVTFSFDRIGDVACGVTIDLAAGAARVRAAFRGTSLPPGATRKLPTLFVDGISPAHQAIDEAADRVAAIYRPMIRGHIPSGWCSWYYYYTHITEEAILENLRFAAAHREILPLEYVQIDDGYQRHWGDWLEPSGKFPHDMAWMAREIKALGFRPGLWVAPLIMSAQSALYKAHPDWALKRFETGEPFTMEGWSPKDENPWVILDGTQPGVLAHLKQLFAHMAHEWGYDYFKLDAIAFGASSGLRHRPELTGEETLRLVFETIREAVGPGKYILGCGAPFGSTVGLVDGERVSDDVSTAFRLEQFVCPMEVSLPQSIHRSFIHGKWWHNDPDCILVRRDGTPHQPGLDQFGLTLDEARFFTTVVGLTQGIQMVGEKLSALEPERMELLETMQPPLPAPARPLDLFSPQPEFLLAPTPRGLLLGLLNWTREPKRLAFSPAGLGLDSSQPHEAFELWTQSRLTLRNGESQGIAVPAQGCRLLLIRPAAPHPMFLGYSGHLSCGASLLKSEQWESGILHLAFQANRPGLLYIAAPEGWTPEDPGLASSAPGTWTCGLGKGLYRLSFRFRPPRA